MIDMDKKIIASFRTVFASCLHPKPRCPLYAEFEKNPNVRATKSFTSDKHFVCSLAVRGDAAEISDNMTALCAFAEQICALCQEQRIKRGR